LVDGAVARQGPELDVGIAVAATEQHAVAPENRQRETGNVLSGELGANIAFDGIEGSGLGSRGSGERECGGQDAGDAMANAQLAIEAHRLARNRWAACNSGRWPSPLAMRATYSW